MRKYVFNIIVGIVFGLFSWALFYYLLDKFYLSSMSYIGICCIAGIVMLPIYIIFMSLSILLFHSSIRQFFAGSIPGAFFCIIPWFIVMYRIDGFGAIFGSIWWCIVLLISIGLGSCFIGIFYWVRHKIQNKKGNIRTRDEGMEAEEDIRT